MHGIFNKILLVTIISAFLWSCKDNKIVSIGEACCTSANIISKANCYLSLPNIITPNGDGKNDSLRLHYNVSCPMSSFELKITNYKVEDKVIFETKDPNFIWRPELPTSGFGVYKLTMKCSFAGEKVDIEQPITLYDKRVYLYDPISLECCATCVLPDMFEYGNGQPTQPSNEGVFCE